MRVLAQYLNMTTTPKKILIFSLAYYPRFVGGAEVAIKEITDRLSPEDIEFHLITLRFDSELPVLEKIGNVTVHRIGWARPNPTMADLRKVPLALNKPWFQFDAAFKALSLHREHRFDAAWAMMAHSAGVPATLFNMFTGVPYVLTLQEGDPPEAIERTMRPLWPLFSRAFRRASVVQVISSFLGTWARSRNFHGSLETIPNGVNLELFGAERPALESEEIHKRLGIKKNDTMLITTSRLVPKNAIDDCIRALSFLPKDCVFAVLGTGPEELVLRALAAELQVEDRVKFLGFVEHAVMPAYLHAADIFIRPSRSEGMGNSFIEAFAAGVPVIATQEGGISDFLFDPVRNPDYPATGFAVDKNSPEQIAEAIRTIIAPENRPLVRRVVKTAHALALENYDWQSVTLRMRTNVFGKILRAVRHPSQEEGMDDRCCM